MREIGGYIELDTYRKSMLHEEGLKLNCGRNALNYILKAKDIHKLMMPFYMCDSCDKVLADNNVEVRFYHVDKYFKPQIKSHERDEWIYIVNFYGQLDNDYLKTFGSQIIVDNTQAYFQTPIDDIDTIYSCRKYFGVTDGAVLYTDKYLNVELPVDESYNRLNFIIGRYECGASDFYLEYVNNNKLFGSEPIKKMSRLTENLLRGVDYEYIKNRRTENYIYLMEKFNDLNEIVVSNVEGGFMYPLYIQNGMEIKRKLQKIKIYVPTLWPAVFKRCEEKTVDYLLARNIVPLPVDQRYNIDDMEYMFKMITSFL